MKHKAFLRIVLPLLLTGLLPARAEQAADPGAASGLKWSPDTGYSGSERRPVVTEDSPIARYNDLLSLFEREQYGDAARLAENLAEEEAYEKSPLLERIMYYRGESLFMQGNLHDALEAYEELLKRYPNTIFVAEVLQREFEIARRYLDGSYQWSFLGIPVDMQSRGRALIDKLLQRAPYSRFAAEAHFLLAKDLFDRGQYISAELDFRMIPQFYPDSPYAKLAMMYRARCLLEMFAGPAYDQAPARDAEVLFREFRSDYPAGPPARQAQNYRIEARNKQAAKLLKVAEYYRGQDREKSAAMYYRRVVEKFSDTPSFAAAVRRLRAMGEEVEP